MTKSNDESNVKPASCTVMNGSMSREEDDNDPDHNNSDSDEQSDSHRLSINTAPNFPNPFNSTPLPHLLVMKSVEGYCRICLRSSNV